MYFNIVKYIIVTSSVHKNKKNVRISKLKSTQEQD